MKDTIKVISEKENEGKEEKTKVLRIKAVSKHFGGIQALDGCSLVITEGSLVALIGPNGSGKSTLFNVISHLENRDRGSIHFKKEEITVKTDYAIARLGISRTFQEVRLFKNMTIRDHFEIALSQDDENLIKSVFGKKVDRDKKIKQLLNTVNLFMPLDTYVTDLSYGQRKLLDLAIAIVKPHSLLMLDEPVAGIAPKLREEIKVILKKLKEKGETILVIEHDMNFVMDIADYIYVLDYGKLIAEGTPEEIQNNEKVLEAYLGT